MAATHPRTGENLDRPNRNGWLPVWHRNLRVWRKMALPSLLNQFGEPLLYLLALGYGLGGLVGELEGMSYVVFLASGIVCSSAMITASFESTYSAYTRMVPQRNWQAMLAAPLDVNDIVLGEVVWAATKSLFSAVAILIVATLLGAVANWSAVLAIPVAFVTGFCFASLGMVITSMAKNYDIFLIYNTLITTPMLLLSGVFFPLERMPEAIQLGATVLPLTHAVAIVRPLVTGTPVDSLWPHLAVVLAYAAFGFALATFLIRRRLLA